MQFGTRRVGEVLVVDVGGRLDSRTVGEAGDRLTAVAQGPDRKVVLNLARLDYVSSAGLRAILLCAKLMQSKDGEVRISDASGHVAEVLDTSGFHSLLVIHPTEAEAVAAFAAGG